MEPFKKYEFELFDMVYGNKEERLYWYDKNQWRLSLKKRGTGGQISNKILERFDSSLARDDGAWKME